LLIDEAFLKKASKLSKKDYTEEKNMYCKKCGTEIESGATFCPICGAKVEGSNQTHQDDVPSYTLINDAPESLESLTLLAFIFAFVQPLIGLILAIVANGHNYGPRNKSFSKAALIISISFMAFSVLVVILLIVIMLAMGGSLIHYIDNISYILI